MPATRRSRRTALERLETREVPAILGPSIIATGAGFGGGPHVKVFNTDASLRYELFAYNPLFRGGVRVATGDLNGDGFEDVITGAGPSGGPHVRAFDGRSGVLLADFFAFDATYTDGVYV